MAIYVAGVLVQELREGFSEGIADGGPRASKSYLCAWTDRFALANGILGLSTVTGGVNGTISFTHPQIYAESANLFAREITIRGIGAISVGPKQIAFTNAIVSVNYGIPSYNFDRPADGGVNELDPSTPFVYVSQSLDFGSQVVTVPKGVLKYASGAKTLQQTYGIPVRIVTMNLTFHRVPFLVPLTVRNNVGSMNSVAFLGCGVGTLLFDGIRTQREFNSDGTVVQETGLTLLYRPIARWDYILDPDGASGWSQVTYNGASILGSFDMNALVPNGYKA